MEASSLATLACCVCGVSIEPNPSYKCLACIKTEFDMTQEISQEVHIYQCRGCERYLDPPSHWLNAPMQSRQQLSYCLKRVRGLDKFRLINATFLYTEPHSKRIKIEITVQKEVDGGAVLEQQFVVEFVVGNQFCTDCHRVEAKDFWKAVVQVRQRVNHSRTLYYLEQMMLRNSITSTASSIKTLDSGLDIFFAHETDARRVVDFIQSTVICSNFIESKKMISHDVKSNVYHNKYSKCVDLAPVCKDDLVCLPPALRNKFGGMSPICLVARAARQLLLIDINTAQTYEVNALAYKKHPFVSFAFSRMLDQFIVMETELTDVKYFSGQGRISKKHTVCDVWVQKASQMGTDQKFFCRTHLGGILKIGDTVLGYDLKNINLNNEEFNRLKEHQIPDVVLVKKYYGSKSLRKLNRKWKLKTLHQGKEDDRDYNEFLEDLEEDPSLRKNVNIYRDESKENTAPMMDLDGEDPLEEDVPVIGVEEMLEQLDITSMEVGGEEPMTEE